MPVCHEREPELRLNGKSQVACWLYDHVPSGAAAPAGGR
jgi:hypothetical protein